MKKISFIKHNYFKNKNLVLKIIKIINIILIVFSFLLSANWLNKFYKIKKIKKELIKNNISLDKFDNIVREKNSLLLEKAGNEIKVSIEIGYQAMLTNNVSSKIEAALSNYWQHPCTLTVEFVSEQQKKTPAQIEKQFRERRLGSAKEKMVEDPCLKEIIHELDAEVTEKSIQLVDDKL